MPRGDNGVLAGSCSRTIVVVGREKEKLKSPEMPKSTGLLLSGLPVGRSGLSVSGDPGTAEVIDSLEGGKGDFITLFSASLPAGCRDRGDLLCLAE